jgi:DNA polymerase
MFIGEAPGFHEDQQGRPFVGRAGKILDDLLCFIGLSRDQVYIANILKCRPPGNRNPKSSEIDACTGYLDTQIECIDPKVLVPLGNFACQYIFHKYSIPLESISKIHGKVFRMNTLSGLVIIIPMYHPAVATYNPTKITVLREDIKHMKDFLDSC